MSTLIDVGGNLAVATGAAGLSFAASWAGTWPLRGTSRTIVRHHRRGMLAGLAATAAVVFPAVFLVDAVTWVGAALFPTTGEPHWTGFIGPVVDFLLLGYPAVVAAAVGWTVNHPATDARDFEHLRGLAAGYTVTWAVICGVALGVPALLATGLDVATSVLPVAAIGLTMALLPRLTKRYQDLRPLDDEERAVFEEGFALAGVDPADQPIEVIETDPGDDRIGMLVLGVRWRRVVFVRDTVFDAFDREHLPVLAALLGASARSWRRDVRALAAGALVGVIVLAAVTAESTLGFMLFLLAVFAVAVLWLATSLAARRLTYRNDDRVADQAGAGTVADALVALADRGAADDSRIARLMLMVPSVDRRVQRLRERAE